MRNRDAQFWQAVAGAVKAAPGRRLGIDPQSAGGGGGGTGVAGFRQGKHDTFGGYFGPYHVHDFKFDERGKPRLGLTIPEVVIAHGRITRPYGTAVGHVPMGVITDTPPYLGWAPKYRDNWHEEHNIALFGPALRVYPEGGFGIGFMGNTARVDKLRRESPYRNEINAGLAGVGAGGLALWGTANLRRRAENKRRAAAGEYPLGYKRPFMQNAAEYVPRHLAALNQGFYPRPGDYDYVPPGGNPEHGHALPGGGSEADLPITVPPVGNPRGAAGARYQLRTDGSIFDRATGQVVKPPGTVPHPVPRVNPPSAPPVDPFANIPGGASSAGRLESVLSRVGRILRRSPVKAAPGSEFDRAMAAVRQRRYIEHLAQMAEQEAAERRLPWPLPPIPVATVERAGRGLANTAGRVWRSKPVQLAHRVLGPAQNLQFASDIGSGTARDLDAVANLVMYGKPPPSTYVRGREPGTAWYDAHATPGSIALNLATRAPGVAGFRGVLNPPLRDIAGPRTSARHAFAQHLGTKAAPGRRLGIQPQNSGGGAHGAAGETPVYPGRGWSLLDHLAPVEVAGVVASLTFGTPHLVKHGRNYLAARSQLARDRARVPGGVGPFIPTPPKPVTNALQRQRKGWGTRLGQLVAPDRPWVDPYTTEEPWFWEEYQRRRGQVPSTWEKVPIKPRGPRPRSIPHGQSWADVLDQMETGMPMGGSTQTPAQTPPGTPPPARIPVSELEGTLPPKGAAGAAAWLRRAARFLRNEPFKSATLYGIEWDPIDGRAYGKSLSTTTAPALVPHANPVSAFRRRKRRRPEEWLTHCGIKAQDRRLWNYDAERRLWVNPDTGEIRTKPPIITNNPLPPRRGHREGYVPKTPPPLENFTRDAPRRGPQTDEEMQQLLQFVQERVKPGPPKPPPAHWAQPATPAPARPRYRLHTDGRVVNLATGETMPGRVPIPRAVARDRILSQIPRWKAVLARAAHLIEGEPFKAELTARGRNRLDDEDFALPGRRYPLHDIRHARSALSYGARHASPEELAIIRRKVHARYPGIEMAGKAAPVRLHKGESLSYVEHRQPGDVWQYDPRFARWGRPFVVTPNAPAHPTLGQRIMKRLGDLHDRAQWQQGRGPRPPNLPPPRPLYPPGSYGHGARKAVARSPADKVGQALLTGVTNNPLSAIGEQIGLIGRRLRGESYLPPSPGQRWLARLGYLRDRAAYIQGRGPKPPDMFLPRPLYPPGSYGHPRGVKAYDRGDAVKVDWGEVARQLHMFFTAPPFPWDPTNPQNLGQAAPAVQAVAAYLAGRGLAKQAGRALGEASNRREARRALLAQNRAAGLTHTLPAEPPMRLGVPASPPALSGARLPVRDVLAVARREAPLWRRVGNAIVRRSPFKAYDRGGYRPPYRLLGDARKRGLPTPHTLSQFGAAASADTRYPSHTPGQPGPANTRRLPGRPRRWDDWEAGELARAEARDELSRVPVSRVLARQRILRQVPRWQAVLERAAQFLRNEPFKAAPTRPRGAYTGRPAPPYVTPVPMAPVPGGGRSLPGAGNLVRYPSGAVRQVPMLDDEAPWYVHLTRNTNQRLLNLRDAAARQQGRGVAPGWLDYLVGGSPR